MPLFLIAQSQKISGVSINYGEIATKIPVQWRKEPIKGQVNPISVSEISPIIKKIEIGLKKYPEHILKENLAGIQLVRNLIFFEKYYPGTYTHNRIWLAKQNLNQSWTPQFLESVLHREISSILLNNYPRYFNQYEWECLLPVGMEWQTPEHFNPDSLNLNIDSEWLDKGFLNAWASSSLENDFNAISARLFSGEKEFWTLVNKYPILHKKVLLSLQFYHSLDQKFTESYFRSLVGK